MIKKLMNNIFYIILFICLFAMYYIYSSLNLSPNRVVFYYSTPLDKKAVETFTQAVDLSKEDIAYAFWSSKKDVKLSSETQKHTLDQYIEAYGQVRMVCDDQVISGRMPLSDEPDLALISGMLEQTLFSLDPKPANTVFIDDKEYPVVGTFKNDETIAIVSGNGRDGNFHFAEMEFNKDKTINQVSTIVSGLQLPTASFEISYRDIRAFLVLMFVIAIVLIALPLLGSFYKLIVKDKSKTFSTVIFFLFLFVLAVCIPKILQLLPPDWIPNKWSDFTFWKERTTYITKVYSNIFAIPYSGRLIEFKDRIILYLCVCLITFVFAVVNIVNTIKKHFLK